MSDTADIVIGENRRCDRCDRRKPKDAGGWRANVEFGYVVGVTCDRCLSPEESIAMCVNEILTEVAHDRNGRVMVRPRAQRDEEGHP